MSVRNSPGMRKPYLPLRGRSKRVPTKRVFTFTQSWTNSDAVVSEHAEVTKMLGGRGEIIRVSELSSSKPLSKHVAESPVPLIITSPVPQIIPAADDEDDEDGEEEMEVEEEEEEDMVPETQPSASPTPEFQTSSVPQSVTGSIQEGIEVQNVTLNVHKGQIQPAKDDRANRSGNPREKTSPQKKSRSFTKVQGEESDESDAESTAPSSQPQFDDRIEGGHFAHSRLELSRISHVGGDYRRQRHSTPIPSSRTRTFLDTVVPTPRPNQSEQSSPEAEEVVPSPRSLKKRPTKGASQLKPTKRTTPVPSAKKDSPAKSKLSSSRRSPRIAEVSAREAEPIVTPTTSKKSNVTGNRRSLFAPAASPTPNVQKKKGKQGPRNKDESAARLPAQSTLDSFVFATPRSERPSKPTTKRQRAPTRPLEVSDAMPDDVRVWQDGVSKRSLTDITDLDVVLERLEEVAWNIKDRTEERVERRAINRLMVKTQEDIRQTITDSHSLKKLKASVAKSSSIVRKKRKDLLALQIDNAKLKAEVQRKKKQQLQQVPYRDPKSMQEISDFLTKLSSFSQNLAKSSKQPKRSPKKFVVFGRSKEEDSSVESLTVRRRLYLRE